MAGVDNLINGHDGHQLTREEQQAGGRKSGEVRARRKKMRQDLEYLLSSNAKGIDKITKKEKLLDKTYQEMVTEGLIANAINSKKGGNPQAYKLIAQMLGEYEETSESTSTTPSINIKVVDNSNLEDELYKDNKEE